MNDDHFPTAEERLAKRNEAMAGKRCIGLLHPRVELLSGNVGSLGMTTRYECPCGKWRWIAFGGGMVKERNN